MPWLLATLACASSLEQDLAACLESDAAPGCGRLMDRENRDWVFDVDRRLEQPDQTRLFSNARRFVTRRHADRLRAACDRGNPQSCIDLAALQLGRELEPSPDLPGILATLQTHCDAGYPDACGRLATSLWLGDGVPREPERALELDARTCPTMGLGCGRLAWAAFARPELGADRLIETSAYQLAAEECTKGYAGSCTVAGCVAPPPVRAQWFFDKACDPSRAMDIRVCLGERPLPHLRCTQAARWYH